MKDKILAFFGFKKTPAEYVWEIEQTNKRDVTIGEYVVTITTKNGDVITVPFSERLTKQLLPNISYEDKNIYDYDHYTVRNYVEELRYSRLLSFQFPNGSGTLNCNEISKIDYVRTHSATIEVCREIHTRKIKE
jgi:hypothetical protein